MLSLFLVIEYDVIHTVAFPNHKCNVLLPETSVKVLFYSENRYALGVIVTRQWDGRLWNLSSIPDQGSDLSLRHCFQTRCGPPPSLQTLPPSGMKVKNTWFCNFSPPYTTTTTS